MPAARPYCRAYYAFDVDAMADAGRRAPAGAFKMAASFAALMAAASDDAAHGMAHESRFV